MQLGFRVLSVQRVSERAETGMGFSGSCRGGLNKAIKSSPSKTCKLVVGHLIKDQLIWDVQI